MGQEDRSKLDLDSVQLGSLAGREQDSSQLLAEWEVGKKSGNAVVYRGSHTLLTKGKSSFFHFYTEYMYVVATISANMHYIVWLMVVVKIL